MTTYSLEELTERAGVTVRTVRYYIAEGLLPPPVGGGPRSAYTEGHLDRLRLIGRLKDAYLPLREIRRRVAGLDDEEVRAALAQAEPPAAAAAESIDSAADYITRVLQEQRAREVAPRPSDRAEVSADFRRPPRAREATAPNLPSEAAPEPAAWRRLPITEEAELLIREDAYQRRAEQLDSLITWIKRVLS